MKTVEKHGTGLHTALKFLGEFLLCGGFLAALIGTVYIVGLSLGS